MPFVLPKLSELGCFEKNKWSWFSYSCWKMRHVLSSVVLNFTNVALIETPLWDRIQQKKTILKRREGASQVQLSSSIVSLLSYSFKWRSTCFEFVFTELGARSFPTTLSFWVPSHDYELEQLKIVSFSLVRGQAKPIIEKISNWR